MPRRVINLFFCWRGLGGSPQCVAMRKLVLSCQLWCLWREGTDRYFEEHKKTMVELKSFVFKTLYYWAAGLDLSLFSFL